MRRLVLHVALFCALALTAADAWAHGFPGQDARYEPAAEVVVVLAEPTPRPDAAPWIERAFPWPLAGGSGVGGIQVASLVAVGLVLVGFRRSRHDRRTTIATITAALVLGFILETTPHLVHHSLDADQGAGCEALQTAERSQAASGAGDSTPVAVAAALDESSPVVPVPTSVAPAPCGRAPPA